MSSESKFSGGIRGDDADNSAAQVLHDAALTSADPAGFGINDEALQAFTVPAGAQLHVIDVQSALEKHGPGPTRKSGAFGVHDGESFVAYLDKHAGPQSEVWADSLSQQIVGVVNSHTAGPAGWGDHRVTYKVELTEAWKAWKAVDGRLGPQAQFAELIEDRLVDIVRPDAADLLEIAQSFEATIGVRFESTKLLSTGERQFSYKENVDASAGRAGQLEVPKDFELALQPFEGADVFKVTARLRYRITDGSLQIGFKLVRPEDVLREAFESVVSAVEVGLSDGIPVFRGVSA